MNNIRVKHYIVKSKKEKNNPLKFIVGVVSYALFIWLVLLGVALLLYLGDTKLKALKGDTTPPLINAFSVLTGSMIPNINIKDVVITKTVDASTLEKDDIITFISSDPRVSGITVTHRIVDVFYDNEKNKYSFKTKGDNNNCEDMYLASEDNVIGKVIFKIPKLGYLQDILAKSGGWIIVVIIPCLVIVSYDIMKVFRKIIKKQK